ncbi:hypothetical protein [Schaalia cardiffensis]|uniref:hypothetical protein n=1 Tax=Schaalia cardiffensis TaxID=181487 RepID=UPI0023F1E6BA|nr:hypothetical protein [Schaalia cardiffensis]
MTVTAWVAAHTGLPCFYSTEDVTLTTPDGRILHMQGDGAPFLVADALAAPGVVGVYSAGLNSVNIARVEHRIGVQVVTTLAGRGPKGLGAQPVTDDQAWKTDGTVFKTGAVRYRRQRSARTGNTRILLYNPEDETLLLNVLESRGPIIIGTGAKVQGVEQLRIVVISSYQSEWLSHEGLKRYTLSWEEYRSSLNPLSAYRAGVSGSAPVVTWGDWEAYRASSDDLADHSTVELARLIAGMPS